MKRKLIPLISSSRLTAQGSRLKNSERIFLAPMEEVNDTPFRLLCKKAGAGLTYTELTSPLSPKELELPDKPVLQIFASDDLFTAQSSRRKAVSDFINRYDSEVSGWDFNLGCPATNAQKRKFGAYLDNPEFVEEIISFMREHTNKPLSIKIRKSPFENDYLKIAEKYCDVIGIHPRTREQGYSGEPDIKWAKEFKKKAKIPVIYSGNIDEENCEEFLKTFDYVMIGRNSIGHPEIFYNIAHGLRPTADGPKPEGLRFKDYLELAEKYNIEWRKIKFQAMQFTKGDRGSRQKRAKMVSVHNLEDLKKIFFE